MALSGDLPVLQAALRTRITDASLLAEVLRLPADEVRAALDRLADDGFVVRTDEGLPALPPPQRAVVESALGRVLGQVAALEGVHARLESLPERLREWAGVHGAERAEVPMELSHGPDAVVDAWWRLRDRSDPLDAFACFPDPVVLARLAAEGAATAPVGSRVRFLVERPAADAAAGTTVDDATATALQKQGTLVRTLGRVPGWFAGAGGDRSAFPTAWGNPWPHSVRVLRDPLAARSLRSLFDELWRRAVPVEELPAEWEAVLLLLAEGLDDAAVAGRLGVSERTVRRRVEEAMIDLGATSRFTLGRAWATRRP